MASHRRLDWLRGELERNGSVRIDESARALGVSEMTIRRDLEQLELMGVARRVRGGAIPAWATPLTKRNQSHRAAKAVIAQKLLAMLPTSGAIAVDGSSTLMRMVAAIPDSADLTVLTNGPETFDELRRKRNLVPVLTGGQLEPRTGSLVGPIACQSSGHLLLHRLFVSAAAVDPVVGASEVCEEEAEVKRILAAMASEVVLAVDSSKLDLRAVAVSLEWGSINTLVTELEPDDPRLASYAEVIQLR
ncbi:MAG TPA: DeoR/GlpR family DNA-binding transcription regulator [Mycobacteriales bacterium]|nr:DeoR/GlpR family DNA-binding transcription regulator [Mycobacteriales bacterium]